MRSLGISLLFSAFIFLGFDISPKAFKKEIRQYRKEQHKKFKNPQESPFRDKVAEYKGLKYFPANIKYRVNARYERLRKQKAFKIKTSNPERDKTFVPFAKLHFTIDGKELSLTTYRNLELPRIGKFKKQLFLPFMDLTNGESTYGGGRYIDLEMPEGDSLILDFNKSYNPYCAYRTDGWSCPIPPEENFLEMEIKAGVKKYKLKY
ncbi:MAG: DUF1684 domain-containing protein [Bacteroidota bacterium]